MKKIKKVLSMTLAVAIATAMLTACGDTAKSNGETTTSQSTATVSEAAPTVEKLEPVTLNWYVAGNEPKEKGLVEEEMTKQVKEKLNADIKLNWIDYGNYGQKMNVMLASGGDFDLCFTASWVDFGANAAKGAYAELNDMLDKNTPTLKATIPESFWAAATIKGKTYAVPNIQPTASQKALIINTTDELKAKYKPETISTMADWDKYIEVVYNDLKDDPKYKPLSLDAQAFGDSISFYDLIPVADSQIGTVIDMNGDQTKIVNMYDTQAYKDFIKMRRGRYNKGWIRKDIITYSKNSDARNADRNAGKHILGEIGGLRPTFPKEAVENKQNTGTDMVVTALVGKKYLDTGNIQATMTAINKNSNNKERALMLIELMNTDQTLFNTMSYGVEGKHWFLENGKVSIPEEIRGEKSAYNPDSAWQFGYYNKLLLPKVEWPEMPLMKDWDTKDVTAPKTVGLVYDLEPIKSEVAKVKAIQQELAVALELGAVDTDKIYNTLKEKLKTAGFDKILEELQRQTDTYLASK